MEQEFEFAAADINKEPVEEVKQQPTEPIPSTNTSDYPCPKCDKPFNSRRTQRQHEKRCSSFKTNVKKNDKPTAVATEPLKKKPLFIEDVNANKPPQKNDEEELKKLKTQVAQLFQANPDSMDEITKQSVAFLARIEKMSLEELRNLVKLHDLELNSVLGKQLVNKGLSILSMVIGKVLGCEQELANNCKDPSFQKHINYSLGTGTLNLLTMPIKTAIYAGTIVLSSLQQSKKRKAEEELMHVPPPKKPDVKLELVEKKEQENKIIDSL